MAKISVSHGLTLKIFRGLDKNGKESFDFWRVDLAISDIDIYGDIDKQIEMSLKAQERVQMVLTEKINKMAKEQLECLKKELEKLTEK